MDSSYSGIMRQLEKGTTPLSGRHFLRLCMDAPQVRLAGLGVYAFPLIDIAVRVALALVWSTLCGWRDTTADFLFHMVNFTLNGWTYGLICEAATLAALYRTGVHVAGRILFWVLLMRCADSLFSAVVPDRYEIKMDSQKNRQRRDSFGLSEKPLAHTFQTALQQSMRPVTGLLLAYFVFAPVLTDLFPEGLLIRIPSAGYLISVASAMAWTFLYRLVSYSVHRADAEDESGIAHGEGERPDRTETRRLWARTIAIPDRSPESWIFWAPLWLGLFAALGTSGSPDPTRVFLKYTLGVLLVPSLYPLWALLFEWADGTCEAYHSTKTEDPFL